MIGFVSEAFHQDHKSLGKAQLSISNMGWAAYALGMGNFHLDESRWPILQVVLEGSMTDETFQDYLKAMSATFDRGLKVGVLLDARKAMTTSASQRTAQAEWMRQNESILQQRTVGIAFVMTSKIVEGIFRAILWLQPLPCPYKVTSTMDEALAWLQKQLEHSS